MSTSSIVETIRHKQSVVEKKIEALQVECKALEAAARVLAGVDNLEVVLDALDTPESAPKPEISVKSRGRARVGHGRLSPQQKAQMFFQYVVEQQRAGEIATQAGFARKQAELEGSGKDGITFHQKSASLAAKQLIREGKIQVTRAPAGQAAHKAYALTHDPFTYKPQA